MNLRIMLIIALSLPVSAEVMAQRDSMLKLNLDTPVSILSIVPGIGVHTNAGTDVLLSGFVQWNPSRRLALVSHTAYIFNNILQRNVNTVRTEYNYSINQKFGIGATLYKKNATNTMLVMAGFKYTAFQETLNNPNFEKATASVSRLSPDYGLAYSYRRGYHKYFFSFRAYIPLYPWPVKTSNVQAIDGNMNNISLEFALGIRIK